MKELVVLSPLFLSATTHIIIDGRDENEKCYIELGVEERKEKNKKILTRQKIFF